MDCAQAPEQGQVQIGHAERITRFASLYSTTIQHFIDQHHIVIGCGSIGGYIIRTLGQIGVKKIELWDHDIVEMVNVGPQGFHPADINRTKVLVRSREFQKLNPEGQCVYRSLQFRKKNHYPEGAYWWMCVDTLEAREDIFETARRFNPYRIIDTRMGALSYEVYNLLARSEAVFHESIEYARQYPVNEGCTSKSTPHAAMVAASLAISMGLSPEPPYLVAGNLLSYEQKTTW